MNKQLLGTLVLGLTVGLSISFTPDMKGMSPRQQIVENSQRQRSGPASRLEVIKQFQGHQLTGEAIIQIHYSRDGRYLLSTATDGLAKLWTPAGNLIREFAGMPVAMLFNGAFSPDAGEIATAGYDGVVRIWSIEGKVLHELRGHTSGVTDVVFLPHKQGVLSSSDDGTVKLWSQEQILTSSLTRVGVSRNMDISPQRNLIAVTQDIGTVTLLNPQGEVKGTIETGQGRLNDVSFSEDGNWVITAGFDGTARVFTLDGKEVVKLNVLDQGWVTGAAISRHQMIATVSDDGILRLWNFQGTLLDSYNPDLERLGSVAFAPDGKHLAIAAYHGTIILLSVK